MRRFVFATILATALATGAASAASAQPAAPASAATPAGAASVTMPATAASTTAPASAASVAIPASAASGAGPAAGSGTTAPAIAASATPSPEVAGAKLSPADRKRMLAIEQYQHDLVTVVALRADPDYLLGAAILSAPFKDPTPGLDFDALSERATAGGGAASHWARLGICKSTKDCPNADAWAWLKQHAADNAAVWIVALDIAARDKNAKAERAALKHVAEAKTYDDYYGKALAGVAKAVTVLPPLPDTMQGAHDGQPDNAEGVRMLVAMFANRPHIRPGFDPLDQLCNKHNASPHPDVKADCLKLAHTLQWGSSPLARAMGLRIAGELDATADAKTAAASRNLGWQVQQYSKFLQGALTERARAQQWLASARNGGTELSLVLATLRANGIDLDAPADNDAPTAPSSSSP